MTCIVGINTGSKIIIAGDRMGSNGFTYGQYHEKVFKKDEFIFGVCGSYRVMQLIKHKFAIPKMKVGQEANDYLYNDFTDAFIALIRNNNCAVKKDNIDTMEAGIVFGFQDKLYIMENNFQILSNNKGYEASGSGCYHAVASLYSTQDLNITPEDRLKKAIVCASEFVLSVDSSVDMVELEYTK
jgi:ATP-dependent protease HslVU (ClpYQ) peptidase subunit